MNHFLKFFQDPPSKYFKQIQIQSYPVLTERQMFLMMNEKEECIAGNAQLGMHSSVTCRMCSLISNYNVTLSPLQ